MKIIIFDGGPRKGWNTARMCESFAAGAAEAGAEVETVRLYDLDFKGCRSCFACKVKGGASYGRCAQRDGASGLLERAAQADGIVFASPVYLWTVTPQLHALIERLIFPLVSYAKEEPALASKRIETAMIYTMNVKESAHSRASSAAYSRSPSASAPSTHISSRTTRNTTRTNGTKRKRKNGGTKNFRRSCSPRARRGGAWRKR